MAVATSKREGPLRLSMQKPASSRRTTTAGFDSIDPPNKISAKDIKMKDKMKNIQIIDGAMNATFSIFRATEQEFSEIFPGDQDMEFSEDFHRRVGQDRAQAILTPIWDRPIRKCDVVGLHGTLFYDWLDKRKYLPKSKREVDWDEGAINDAQRKLFRSRR